MLDIAVMKEDIAAFLQLVGFVFFWFFGYIQKEVEKKPISEETKDLPSYWERSQQWL